jgi:pyruvate/2-oxoglutarate dehydrogenase complex dihydrolipoamide dehydrogenase (E3) component
VTDLLCGLFFGLGGAVCHKTDDKTDGGGADPAETEARKAGLRVKSAMATGTDRPGICPNPHRITIKLVYEANTRQVLGAQAWGEKNVSARINAIAVAIRAGMTVEALGQVDFVYSSSSCSIWDPVQIVCGQAQ